MKYPWEEINQWPEFKAVKIFYGEKKAKRSQVPLIKHICEGLIILDAIGASKDAMKAYCLHPLFQTDKELSVEGAKFIKTFTVNPEVLMNVLEYRYQANSWLSEKVQFDYTDALVLNGKPTPGPLVDVRDMLIADKVQNRKDFLIYHAESHPRWKELDIYFKEWLKVLNISEAKYESLVAIVQQGMSKLDGEFAQ
jgi:hypothetical protein